jgi:electron transfer flavoprotein beta subunit
MRILCLLKLVGDVDNLRYDPERNILVRDDRRLMLNPEDAVAAATALALKQDFPDLHIEVVSMGPPGARPHLEDLVRRGLDRATLISDPRYAGSDTWATSAILGRFLQIQVFDCVFCGTHTLDGGTAQVPAQVAELLGLPYLGGISALDGTSLAAGRVLAEVEEDVAVLRFSVALPAILGFQFAPKRKLPYIRYEDLNRDVSDRIAVIGNDQLGLDPEAIGLRGSRTQVKSLEAEAFYHKDTLRVGNDPEGIETVFRFLETRGFLAP